ncbi:hypothetical protein PC113_g13285 [Phytophthora cactorum]|uniref:Uncharacterized protein n=1 Tax=Phytophthora cactorum TaxID=29920 RepID=A0A8T0YXQ9_9STRA|nr:hypothetical protein PC113_g13285 [Phytophthora cactorum]
MEHEVCTASGDDIEASASAGSSYCSAEEDGEIVEIDEAVTEHIDTVLGVTCCENDCIASHPEAVTNFLRGYMKMTKDCQRTSLVTALAMCLAFSEDNQRHRSTGVRQRYAYFVPLVSQVCRTAFKTAYNVSNDTINRYRNQAKKGDFADPVHENAANKHAQFVDEEALKAFFTRLASTQADCVPVRFRYQKTVDGELRRYHTTKEYQLLPSYFTWGMMHGWYIKWAKDARVRIKEPSLSFFRTVLERICPEIRIRSVRDNVCDACVIYRNTMGAEPTVDDTEAIVAHVEDATAMRAQYKADCEAATYRNTGELYKKLDNIHSYQVFEVRDAKNFSADEVSTFWASFTLLSPPPPNKEKIHDIHKKVLQYVPPDLRSDPLYIVPDAADRAEVAATKRFRRQKAVQKKKRPAANADAPRQKRAADIDNQ